MKRSISASDRSDSERGKMALGIEASGQHRGREGIRTEPTRPPLQNRGRGGKTTVLGEKRKCDLGQGSSCEKKILKRKAVDVDENANNVLGCPSPDLEEDEIIVSKANTNIFYSYWAAYRYGQFSTMKVVGERNLVDSEFRLYGAFDVIQSSGLLGTVMGVEPYCKKMVLEFYCNLTKSMNNKNSPRYGKVFCRNTVLTFDASSINNIYPLVTSNSLPVLETRDDIWDVISCKLTSERVRKWPKSGFSVDHLNFLARDLHNIGLKNWFPIVVGDKCRVTKVQGVFLYCMISKRRIDFGSVAYVIIMSLAETPSLNHCVPFPSLIYKFLTSHGVAARKSEQLEMAKCLSYTKTQVAFRPENLLRPSMVFSNLPAFIQQQINAVDCKIKVMEKQASFLGEQVEELRNEKRYLNNVAQCLGPSARGED